MMVLLQSRSCAAMMLSEDEGSDIRAQQSEEEGSNIIGSRCLQVTVLRNGQTEEISTADLLVGDVMLLDTGDILAADGLLFEGNDIRQVLLAFT